MSSLPWIDFVNEANATTDKFPVCLYEDLGGIDKRFGKQLHATLS